MVMIHINIGSNISRKKNINLALKNIKKYFDNIKLSSVYESRAIGFDGPNFYNLGLNTTTKLSIYDIFKILQDIELEQGRIPNCKKFSSRTLDLDLSLYGQVVNKRYNIPRDDILKYNFVLAPLIELSPDGIHPVAKKTYLDLWQKFSFAKKSGIKKHDIKILE